MGHRSGTDAVDLFTAADRGRAAPLLMFVWTVSVWDTQDRSRLRSD